MFQDLSRQGGEDDLKLQPERKMRVVSAVATHVSIVHVLTACGKLLGEVWRLALLLVYCTRFPIEEL